MKTLLKNVKLVNVFTETIEETNVLIDGEIVAGVGTYYTSEDADECRDLAGKYVCPGFVDGHIHIESTMMTPWGLANACLPKGTTSVVTDPHEIANVCGVDGIKYMLQASEGLPLNVYVMLPSCVPATMFDESGANLFAKDLEELYSNKRVLGLAEMMNYPGIIYGDEATIEKVTECVKKDKVVDGHAPLLKGRDLDKYVSYGIQSDHECSSYEEAYERIQKGQWIMIREGSAAKNLEGLHKLIDGPEYQRCVFVTDDRNPMDILTEGHIDNIVRKAIALGKDPVRVIKMASLNAALCFGIKRAGAIAPGYKADILILDDLNKVSIKEVYASGKCIYADGQISEIKKPLIDEKLVDIVSNSFHLDTLTKEDFYVEPKGNKCRVIKVIEGQILTDEVIEELDFTKNNGINTDKDILKLAVIERHKNTGHKGIGYIEGIGLKEGALAASVSHDSHNLIVIGSNDEDMMVAANQVIEMGGGMTVVKKQEVIAKLSLPVAGLMGINDAATMAKDNETLRSKARELGVKENIEPFMNMAFVSLPVIPSLKMTTTGLVDVNQFKKVDLFV